MSFIARFAKLLANVVGFLGIVGIAAMMVHITADVLARYFLGTPFAGTTEIVSRYYMVLIAFLPLAWVEHRNGMISVELLDGFLSRGVKRGADVLVALVSCGVLCLLAWATLNDALREWSKNAFVMALNVPVPTWPTYFFLPIGFGAAALLVFLRAVLLVFGPASAPAGHLDDL